VSEHGILFSAPMVRAILDGRKTQTRRVATRNNSTVSGHNARAKFWAQWWADALWNQAIPTQQTASALHVPCGGPDAGGAIYRVRPIWQPGDRLWVRETWCEVPDEMRSDFDEYIYRADMTERQRLDELSVRRVARTMLARWRPAIHMPRRAARIVLTVTHARGQRLQDISESDAEAEGVNGPSCSDEAYGWYPSGAFRELWESINGKRPGCSWADNPWVWALTFERLELNRAREHALSEVR
jgi:hypothetical protein